MRIAIISSRFPCANHEPYLGAEIAALCPQVEHAIVAPLRPSGAPSQDSGGAEVLLLHPSSLSTLREAWRALRRAPRESAAVLLEILLAPGALVTKLKNLAIYTRALALAQRLHRARIDHVHAYWLSTPATAAWIVARVNHVTWSSTAHRWDIFEQNMIPQKAASALFVRAISQRGRDELVRLAPQAEDRIVVVRLGTALAQRAHDAGTSGRLHLLCAAAFVPVKGHEDLLEAFALAHEQNPALRLTLCGTGPLEKKMRAIAALLPCRDAIAFRGYVPRPVLLRELTEGTYDAVVLASRDDGAREMEGVPSILVEASSLEIACIATTSGSVGELLDEHSAFLTPPQRPAALARAILLAADREERRTRAARAALHARTLHDPARSAAHIAALMEVSA